MWEAFLGGDRQAYETIYRKHHASLYEYGMRKLDNEELVKDCLQDL
ncbi:MAG: sigma-70 family RNA polymerase sigma factor, partial [Bacteroidetes bacterium]|nr:sigma-70 family RNA polymerase sigma factor [Bacteroidota bacterium]